MNPIRAKLIGMVLAGADLSDLVAETKKMDQPSLHAAIREEMDERGREALKDATSLFCIMVAIGRQETNENDFEQQAAPLYLAGWTSEVSECYQTNSKDPWRQCPVASLYWRAPSKRPGKPGRRYLSTNQAFRAMERCKFKTPKPNL